MRRREFMGGLAAPALLPHSPFDAAGQTARRRQIYELHRRGVAPLFDDQGRWAAKSTAPARRELLWNAMSFLASETTRAKGNAVIRQMPGMEAGADHFVHCSAAQLLFKDKGEIEPAVRKRLEDLLYASMKKDGERPIRFMGYNDNFPAMDTAYAVIGGRVLDYPPARRRGRDSLQRASDLLKRRGLFSEYTSATYSPVTLLCYAEVAEFAASAEERVLACDIEARVWLDIAAHWHQPTNVLAGPHSRAYTVDSVGHYHQVQMVLYHVFGERLWMTPLNYLFPPVDRQIIHHDGDVPFMQVSNVWMASGTYHPSVRHAAMLFDKPFPHRVTATSEYGAARTPVMIRGADINSPIEKSGEVFEYPSGELVSTTFMTRDYAVGSATAQFHDGNQTDTFFVNFRRADPCRSLQDVSTIFCRYMTNGHAPGVPWTNPVRPEYGASDNLYADDGRVRAVQKDSTVLVVYQAKGQIVDHFHTLRLVIIVPVFYGSLKRLAVGGKEVTGALPYACEQPEIVWLEDTRLYAAFRPLLPTNHGRPHALRIAEEKGYLTLSFYNYEGVPKRFAREQLHETLNGFVAEIGSRSEGNFADFERRVRSGRVVDEVSAGQRVTGYRRQGVQLGISHSLYFDGLKYVLIDDRPQPRPAFVVNGLAS